MSLPAYDRQGVFGCVAGIAHEPPWGVDPLSTGGHADIRVEYGLRQETANRFANIQAAIDCAVAEGSGETPPQRRIVEIGPGYFEGPIVIPERAPPITLRGASADACIIGAPIDAQMSGHEYARRFAKTIDTAGPHSKARFAHITARQTIGTHNSAVVTVERDDTVISNLTIRNEYQCDRSAAAPKGAEPDAKGRFSQGQHQAVALHVSNVDRVHIADCALIGFQDTLYLRSAATRLCRIALDRCFVTGDVDFIFGGAIAHFQDCIVQTRGERGAQSWAVAPSTSLHQPYGFVFSNCRFTHDGAEKGQNGKSFLGRQWFEGVRATPYGSPTFSEYTCVASDENRFDPPCGLISRTTLESVGKCAVVDSVFDGHLNVEHLWDDWGGSLWTPRFRPVQEGPKEFLRYLEGWLEANGLNYTEIAGQAAWLHRA